MKLTSQEEYGLRILLHLVRGADGDCVTTSEIAASEGISEQYVSKLFRLLAQSGLVEGVRGRSGGFRLARSAADIDLAEVLTTLGGPLYDGATCDRFSGEDGFCVHSSDCSVRSLWSGIQRVLDAVLSRVSLEDLARGEKDFSGRLSGRLDDAESAGVHGAPTLVRMGPVSRAPADKRTRRES